jgi:quercetin dioxygenase-like cupin family protein
LEKPDGSSKYSRVWNLKQTPTIRVNLVEFTGEILLHKHPDADHSLLVLEGKVQVQAANDKFIVTKGDFFSIPANVPHKYWTLSKKAVLVSMDAPYYDPSKTIRLE